MRVLLFGATGMIGQGVLRECLEDSGVSEVLAVGRSPTGRTHPKLKELVRADLMGLAGEAERLAGYDACFWCLGVSASGMSEGEYRRVTYDLTMAIARPLAERNPGMVFVFVSGAGTDTTGTGRSMWARVKGETENALLKLGFRAAYMFRPAMIRPMHGATSRTRLYRAVYAAMGPLFPLMEALFPKYVTTTERVGRAMLRAARDGAPKAILENDDINRLAG